MATSPSGSPQSIQHRFDSFQAIESHLKDKKWDPIKLLDVHSSLADLSRNKAAITTQDLTHLHHIEAILVASSKTLLGAAAEYISAFVRGIFLMGFKSAHQTIKEEAAKIRDQGIESLSKDQTLNNTLETSFKATLASLGIPEDKKKHFQGHATHDTHRSQAVKSILAHSDPKEKISMILFLQEALTQVCILPKTGKELTQQEKQANEKMGKALLARSSSSVDSVQELSESIQSFVNQTQLQLPQDREEVLQTLASIAENYQTTTSQTERASESSRGSLMMGQKPDLPSKKTLINGVKKQLLDRGMLSRGAIEHIGLGSGEKEFTMIRSSIQKASDEDAHRISTLVSDFLTQTEEKVSISRYERFTQYVKFSCPDGTPQLADYQNARHMDSCYEIFRVDSKYKNRLPNGAQEIFSSKISDDLKQHLLGLMKTAMQINSSQARKIESALEVLQHLTSNPKTITEKIIQKAFKQKEISL